MFDDIFEIESFEDYRDKQNEYMSSHRLYEYHKDPSVFYMKETGLLPQRDTSAYEFGRAAHVVICEGWNAFNDRYIVGGSPVNPKTGKPYGRDTDKFREWASQYPDKVCLSEEDGANIRLMWEHVHAHAAGQYFHGGIPEAVCRSELTVTRNNAPASVKCQCRIDYWHSESNTIVDLKTTRSLDTFANDAKDYGYFYQMAFYQMVVGRRANIGTVDGYYIRPNVVLVAIEKEEPFRCGLFKFRINDNPLFNAQDQVRKDLWDFAGDAKTDEFTSQFQTVHYFSTT